MLQQLAKNQSFEQSDLASANDHQKGDNISAKDNKSIKGNELQQVVFKVKLKKQIKNIANQTSNRRFQLLNEGKYQYLNDKSTDKPIQQIIHADQSYVELEDKKDNQLIVDKIRELLSNKKRINFFKKLPVFSPSNIIKLLWDITTNFLSLIVMFFIPISFIYNIPLYKYLQYGLNYIIPVFLVLDFFVSCNTSYYEKGRHIFKRQRIVKHFFQNNFFSDILPIIIYFALIIFQHKTSILRLLAFFFYLKLNSIWRIFRKFEESTSLGRLVINIIELIQLLTLILIVSHLFASIWLFIGLNGSQYYQNTWIQQRQLVNEDWKIQYLNSFYYSIVTMNTVGYGDVTPTNELEMVFSVSAIMVCCGIFAYSLNQIGSIFDSFFQLETELRKNMNTINSYMKTKKVSQRLQYQVRQYLDFYWREEYCNNFEVQMKIINQLSDGLKETLLMEANKIALIDSPIFRENFGKSVIAKTVPLIKEIRFNPEEKIFSQDDLDDNNIYFIEQGRVEVQSFYAHPIVKKQKMINCLQRLQKGQSFGEISFFTGQPRKFTIRSLEFSTILAIKRSDFIQLLQEFPDDYEKFCMIRDEIINNLDYRNIGFSCYACGKETHSIGECPIIHFIPKKEKIIRDFAGGKLHERQFFKRKAYKQCFNQLKLEEISKKFSQNQQTDIEQYIDDYLQDLDDSESDSSQILKLEEQTINNHDKNNDQSIYDQFSRSQSVSSLVNQNINTTNANNFNTTNNINNTANNISNTNNTICNNPTNNNINIMESNDILSQSQKSNLIRVSEQKIEQTKQKQNLEGPQMNTFQQLLPKMPSNTSFTDKLFKETNQHDEQSIYQEQLNSNQLIDQNMRRRPSQFKIRQIQIEKDKEEFNKNQKKNSSTPVSINHISDLNFQENKIGLTNNDCKTNLTKQASNAISNQILMIKHQSQLNTQYSQLKSGINGIHNLGFQRARHSVQLLENTLTGLMQNVKIRNSEKIKNQNQADEDILIQNFLNEQLKQIKGFQEDLKIEIETDSIKEFKIYNPKHNFSQIAEKIKQQQQIQQQKLKEQSQIVRKIIKKPTTKANPLKKEDIDLNIETRTPEKSPTQSKKFHFELNICKNQNISTNQTNDHYEEKVKTENYSNIINLSMTQNTNQCNYYEETSKDMIQINNFEALENKRQKYYD